jgi:hypothetical protein
MAKFDELGQQYAERILKAISQDGFAKNTKISVEDLLTSETFREIKFVNRKIDSLVDMAGERISESDKGKVLVELQESLHVPTQEKIEVILLAASNDDLSRLAEEIENILKGQR